MNEQVVNFLKGLIYALSSVLVITLIVLIFKKKPWQENAHKGAMAGDAAAILKVGVLESHRTNSLNPYQSDTDLSNYLTECLYDGLWNYEYDAQSDRITLQNALSADFKPIRVMSNRKEENLFEVHLKSDIKWHDGRTLSAEDVKFSFDYIIQNNISRYFQLKKLLKQVEILDDETVLLTFRKIMRRGKFSDVPLSLITELLSAKVLPRPDNDAIEASAWMAQMAQKPVGTGPFLLERNETDIELKRNPTYFAYLDTSDSIPGKALSKIIFRFFPIQKDVVETFEQSSRGKNEINMLLDVSPVAYERLSSQFAFSRYHTPYFYAIALNGRKEVFQDPETRKILLNLTPRQKIAHTVWDSEEIDQFLHTGPFNDYELKTELELKEEDRQPFLPEMISYEEASKRLTQKGITQLPFILLSEVDEEDELSNAISNQYKQEMNTLPLAPVSFSIENTALSANFIEKVFYATDFDAVLLKVERHELEDYLTKDCASRGRSDPICNISNFERIPGGWEDIFLAFKESSSMNEKRELAEKIHTKITEQALWNFLFTIPKRTYFVKSLNVVGGIHPKFFFSTVEAWHFQDPSSISVTP